MEINISKNNTAIYETNSLSEQEKNALKLLISDAKELGIDIFQQLNDPNTNEIKFGEFLLERLYNKNSHYTYEQKDFLTSLIYDIEKFKEYVDKLFYETNAMK